MSRFAGWSPLVAPLVAATLVSCSIDTPVEPAPEDFEQAADARGEPPAAGPQAVPDEYIVIFREDRSIPPGLARRLAGDHGLTVKHEYRNAVRGFSARIPPQALNGLRNNPFIERIEPNLTYQLSTPTAASVAVPANGLRVRLVADDLSPGDVGSWPNRGSAGDAVQASSSRRPSYRPPDPEFGGHASVGFNEGGDNDENLVIGGASSHGSATVIAVFRQQDANQHNYGLATLYGGRKSRASAVTRYRSGGTLEYWDTNDGWSDGTKGINANQTYVAAWRMSAGSGVDLQVDGASAGTGAHSGPIPAFDSYIIGMTEPSTSARFDGWVAELLIYDRALDDCERDGIVAGLGAWYSVQLAPGFGPCGGTPPLPPSDLQAFPTGTGSIDIGWSDGSTDELGFEVDRSQGAGGPWSTIASLPASSVVYGDTDLDPETQYCYRVRAFNGSGASPNSNESCASTDALPPPPPPISVPGTGLRVRLIANDLGAGDVAAWPNRGSEADALQGNAARRPSYLAPSAEFGGQSAIGFNEGTDNDEALEISGVLPHGSGTLIAVFSEEDASSHNYGLFAPWGSGSNRAAMVTSASSASGRFVYWDSNNSWSQGTATIGPNSATVGAWRVQGGVAADLWVNGAPAGTTTLNSPVPAFDRYVVGMTEPSSSSRFDGRVAELLYYDRALAECELLQIVADLGDRYGVAVAASGGGCSPPAAPTNLGATAVGSDRVDVSWTDASGNEDGFRVQRRPGQATDWQEIATTGPNVSAYSDSGLTASTEFCYRIQAFNSDGSSAVSGEACATTEAAGPLPGPVAVPESGLRVRLVANDLPAGDVASWQNRGSEADAAQSDAARRPTYRAPGPEFGGQASVAFNEGTDNDEALEIGGIAAHGSGTLVAVFREEDAASHNFGLFAPWGSNSSRIAMLTSASSVGGQFVYWDSNNSWSQGTVSVSPDVTTIGSWRVEAGGSADLRVDGAPAGSTTLSSPVPSFDRYVIGMTEPNSTSRFDGWVAELLYYDRALANCELDQILEALGARYDVTVATAGGGLCAPPADPAGLSATPVSYDGVDLAWTDASNNEDGFRVERRLGQAGSWQVIATTGPDVTTFESRNLVQQTEYCYRIVAFNDDGPSGYSSVECATTEAAPPGACVDSGNHDDLSQLYGIQAIGAPANQAWASTQIPGCEIAPWYFGLDSGIDSDHADLNVVEAANFVSAEPNHDGEDGNGHGTHTAGSAAARDGNGGVVGVAPGAPIYSFRVCEDGGSCQTADMVAAMDEVMTRKLANPEQPMVANMSIGGPEDNVIDMALRNSVNAGIVYAVAAGNGILGACIFPANASGVSPARVGDDEIDVSGGSAGNDGLINGVLTTTSHNSSFSDVNCNYGAPVSVAAPGYQIKSTWLNGGYNTISGTSMATPHAAGAALLYLQAHPEATPAEVEEAIVQRLLPWTTNESPNASGRLNVDGF